jgi:hypothetical protein
MVLRTPTFVEFWGAKTTWPFGKRDPPKNLRACVLVNAAFAYVKADGSIIPTFDASAGAHTILPEGKRTPPEKLFAVPKIPTEMFDVTPVAVE